MKKLTSIIHNQRRVASITNNQRRIAKIVLNGIIVWEMNTQPRLELEKEWIFLGKHNSWKDTNNVYTNVNFIVNTY